MKLPVAHRTGWEEIRYVPASWQRLLRSGLPGDAPEVEVKSRICSLSAQMEDVRMWAHYGDSHQGVAIEIDFSSLAPMPAAVTYGKTLQMVGLAPKTEVELFTQKTDHWAYETEYRIVQESPYYSVTGCIRAVHCGVRVTRETVQLLRKLTNDRVPVRPTRLDKNGIRIIPNEVKPSL